MNAGRKAGWALTHSISSGGEGEVLKNVESLLEPGGNEKIALRWQLAHEELEDPGFFHAIFQVPLKHGQLIKVCKQGA